jgi:hypothetical protein
MLGVSIDLLLCSMLNVVMLNVVILSVVAPYFVSLCSQIIVVLTSFYTFFSLQFLGVLVLDVML